MDLCFTEKQGRFNVRVAALIENDGKYLVIDDRHALYEYLVGGRVKQFEDSLSAIKRELFEEINEIPASINLCMVYESFFFERTLKLNYHEIGYIYHVELDKNSPLLKQKETILHGNRFSWKVIDKTLEPQFIFEYIQKHGLPKQLVHLISKEIESD